MLARNFSMKTRYTRSRGKKQAAPTARGQYFFRQHPLFVRVLRHTADSDLAAVQVEEEQHIPSYQPAPGQHLNRKEVGSRQHCPVTMDEVGPGGRFSVFDCQLKTMIDVHFNRLFPHRDPTFVCDDRVCGGVMANLGLPRSSGHHSPHECAENAGTRPNPLPSLKAVPTRYP
jgi:hypothetical protein